MESNMEKNIEWIPDMMLEVKLKIEDSFLIAMETLQRMGMTSFNKESGEKIISQSCHILHKQGKYYIMHFREMYALDGRNNEIPEMDIMRRNSIAVSMEEWGIIDIVDRDRLITENTVSSDRIKIISHKDRKGWTLKSMYKMGTK